MKALKVLSSPDKKRSEPQPFDGRRIEKTQHGFLILNGQHYEDLMRTISRRAYKAKKEREYRESKRNSTPLKGENAAVKALSNGDIESYDKIAAP